MPMPRLRPAGVDDNGIKAQRIVWPDRQQPAQIIKTGRAETRTLVPHVIDKQPHHDRRRMPAGGNQPAVNAFLRRLFIDMEGLRVVFGGEGEHFLFVRVLETVLVPTLISSK